MSSKTWQPALQFGHISPITDAILLVWIYLCFPQHHRYSSPLSFPAAKLFSQKQVKLRALQSSSHTVLLQRSWIITSLVLHLSPQSRVFPASLSFSGLVFWPRSWPEYQPGSHKPAGSHSEKRTISPPASDPGLQTQRLMWLHQT